MNFIPGAYGRKIFNLIQKRSCNGYGDAMSQKLKPYIDLLQMIKFLKGLSVVEIFCDLIEHFERLYDRRAYVDWLQLPPGSKSRISTSDECYYKQTS